MKRLYQFIPLLGLVVGIALKADGQLITDSLKARNGTYSYAKFDVLNQTIPQSRALEITRTLLSLQTDDHLVLIKSEKDDLGYQHDFYQQFYQNLKVERSIYALHIRNGLLESIHGNFARVKLQDTHARLLESAALASAIKFFPSAKYQWQETGGALPKGELLICRDRLKTDTIYRVAYKFNIESADPLLTKAVYVDANTAEVINEELLTLPNHVLAGDGIADTRYSGKRKIYTEAVANGFRLQELRGGFARSYTVRIKTLNMYKKGTDYNKAVDFIDVDNDWTAAEFDNDRADNAALDAHWGAEMVNDYFFGKFDRKSIDAKGGNIIGFVHFTKNWENASWDALNQVMRYGDGKLGVNPYTSLDIIAHEMGHGICQNTHYGGLIYQGESGALNEGLSDIWGASVEQFAAPEKQIWLIAEDVINNGLRNMQNPNDVKALTQGPDTYDGLYWASTIGMTEASDFGGVHTNSSVLNFWFYLLSMGGNGTNDNGNSYELEGIGMDNAAKIIYRAEVFYLKPDAKYEDARKATIQAAEDLFGASSPESKKVNHAWYAVGVGDYGFKQGPTDNIPTTPTGGLEVINNPILEFPPFSISPNPAHSEIKIAVREPQERSMDKSIGFQEIRIMDQSGNWKKSIKYAPNTHNAQLSISELSAGIYIVHIFDGKAWSTQKLMVK